VGSAKKTSDPAAAAQLRQKHPQLGELPGGAGASMPTPGEEYDMPVAYGEDHPDFMRIDHAQLAEDAAGHLGVRRQQPPTEAETSTISSSVLRHTFPLPDRAKGGTRAKRSRFLWGMLPQCAAPAVVLPPLCSGQARGPTYASSATS
jgi:hypothetical protein